MKKGFANMFSSGRIAPPPYPRPTNYHTHNPYPGEVFNSQVTLLLRRDMEAFSSQWEKKLGDQREEQLQRMQELFASVSEENKSLKENVQSLQVLCQEGQECLKEQSSQITSLFQRVRFLEKQNRFRKKTSQNMEEEIKKIAATAQRDLRKVGNTIQVKENSLRRLVTSLQKGLAESNALLQRDPCSNQTKPDQDIKGMGDKKPIISQTAKNPSAPAASQNGKKASNKRRSEKEDEALLEFTAKQHETEAIAKLAQAVQDRTSGVVIAEVFLGGPNAGKPTGRSFKDCFLSVKEALKSEKGLVPYIRELGEGGKGLVFGDLKAKKATYLYPYLGLCPKLKELSEK